MTAPFGRRSADVVSVRRVGAYTIVVVRDPAGAACPPGAGQFYMLAAVAGWGAGEGERPFLPRACSVLAAGAGGELSFLLEDVGPGTRRLCAAAVGESLWLTGPLGVGFGPGVGRPVIVGGGIGVAPVSMLQGVRGGRALLGFRGAGHAAAADLFSDDCRVATDDGSVGQAGLVTDLVEEELSAGGEATVYACGPPGMLEAVRAICERRGVEGQLALESPMACGFGACYGCVVGTREGYRRVCVDGPVFAASALAAVG